MKCLSTAVTHNRFGYVFTRTRTHHEQKDVWSMPVRKSLTCSVPSIVPVCGCQSVIPALQRRPALLGILQLLTLLRILQLLYVLLPSVPNEFTGTIAGNQPYSTGAKGGPQLPRHSA